VARFYHPGLGFSSLLIISEGEYKTATLRALPHYEYPPGTAYDGAMYAQLAMDPLLRDPEIDRALDAPAYRARRILFSGTAYLLGLGKPAWILQAFALQNVLTWLLLAWVLTRWIPPDRPRLFALWALSMFSHGLTMSVRMSLLDGPSLLLLALAVAAAERRRTWLSAGIIGIAGLGRETNLLGAVALPWPRGWRGWLQAAGAGLLVALPMLIWQDYVWSIYRGTSTTAGSDQLTLPFTAYVLKWQVTLREIGIRGFLAPAGFSLLVVIALTVQAIFIVRTRAWTDPWWRLAAVYASLMVFAHWVVWEGHPGAITRVVLPLKFGFNVLLARSQPRGFWGWCILGNLDLFASLEQLPIPGLPGPF
jgi:hypothetical protein